MYGLVTRRLQHAPGKPPFVAVLEGANLIMSVPSAIYIMCELYHVGMYY